MDQAHVLEVYESLTNFPLLIGGSVHDVPLGSGCRPRTTGDSEVMWTYSHGLTEATIEPLGDLARKLAASYQDTLRPSQGGDLHPRLAEHEGAGSHQSSPSYSSGSVGTQGNISPDTR